MTKSDGTIKNNSESVQHIVIKKFFRENIPLDNEVKEIREEVVIGNWIADVFVEFNNGKKAMIEV